jgi:dTDP-4-amino-4,6-dideoxygalactose transaminase
MKNLGNYGNGGAIVTNVQDIADYAKSYRAHGKLFHPAMDTGTNSRMSEIDCATMLVKAQYIDEWQARRKTIATYWMERLLETPLRCLIDSSNVKEHCFHKFVVELDNRDVLAEQLASRGIDTKVHYEEGLNEMNYSAIGFEPMMSATASLCRRVLSLPIYPELTDLEVDYIIDQVLDCVA